MVGMQLCIVPQHIMPVCGGLSVLGSLCACVVCDTFMH